MGINRGSSAMSNSRRCIELGFEHGFPRSEVAPGSLVLIEANTSPDLSVPGPGHAAADVIGGTLIEDNPVR